MKMIKIIRYDTWGNEEDGFEVNDAFTVGNIEREDYCPVETILEYFGQAAVIANDADYGDDREEIINITNGRPLGAILIEGE